MTNGAPENPKTIEEFIDAKTADLTGINRRKATEILGATKTIKGHLDTAGEFDRDTTQAEKGILEILEGEFGLDMDDYQERRRKNNTDMDKGLLDHTYRAYHEFLSRVAAIINNLEGDHVDKEQIAAAIVQYCKQQPENSIFRWMADSDRARKAIRTMVENGVNSAERAELIDAIQKARAESTAAFKEFTEDKIDPLLRTIGLLRGTKGTKKALQEEVNNEIKDLPAREKVLEIFNDYTTLFELEGKDRGLEVRIAGETIELQLADLRNDSDSMKKIAAHYASGRHIVFVAYLTKAPPK
ncbi:hypothetical protein HYW11_02965 [Candidatus Peregrinibacteria bacterium]|nr:hypothetical protein [Candidatus Peregrinibacteria bacterium]